MNKWFRAATVTTSLLSISAPSYAESSVKTLSPEIRALITEEMTSVQNGMQSLIPAYISGDLETVNQIALKIQNSYIIKQKLTKQQKQELMAKLPKSFKHKDKKFHQQAGTLAHVAERKHMELVGFYIAKLTESCVGCHSEHATHKFPKLVPDNDSHHHH